MKHLFCSFIQCYNENTCTVFFYAVLQLKHLYCVLFYSATMKTPVLCSFMKCYNKNTCTVCSTMKTPVLCSFRKCFTCAECKHQMDPTNFANGPDNEVKNDTLLSPLKNNKIKTFFIRLEH